MARMSKYVYILLRRETQGDYNESRNMTPVGATTSFDKARVWKATPESNFEIRDFKKVRRV
jgi:hypothetical protein